MILCLALIARSRFVSMAAPVCVHDGAHGHGGLLQVEVVDISDSDNARRLRSLLSKEVRLRQSSANGVCVKISS